MSNWLAGIIGGIIGAALGILMISIVSVTRRVEQKNSIYLEGRQVGYEVGYDKGYGDGYDVGYRAGIKWMTALKNNRQSPVEFVGDKITIDPNSLRVDIAPGPDSIRPEKRAENETKEARHEWDCESDQ